VKKENRRARERDYIYISITDLAWVVELNYPIGSAHVWIGMLIQLQEGGGGRGLVWVRHREREIITNDFHKHLISNHIGNDEHAPIEQENNHVDGICSENVKPCI
jgi:hypothetical protein